MTPRRSPGVGAAAVRSYPLRLVVLVAVLLLLLAAVAARTTAASAATGPGGVPALSRSTAPAQTRAIVRATTARTASKRLRTAAQRRAAARKLAAAKRAAAARKAAAAKRRAAVRKQAAAKKRAATAAASTGASPAATRPATSAPSPSKAPATPATVPVVSPSAGASPSPVLAATGQTSGSTVVADPSDAADPQGSDAVDPQGTDAAAGEATPSPQIPQITWGMNPGAEIADSKFDAADDRGLAAIAGVGTQELRVAAAWGLADPTGDASRGVPGASFDWTWLDTIARGAASHGMRWEPFLCYPPPSLTRDAGVVCGGPPNDDAAYVRFAAAFVDRYGAGGSFWAANPDLPQLPVRTLEVWNEPNLVSAWPTAVGGADAPEEYADLYRDTRAAIASRPAGQDVTVVFAAMAPIPSDTERPGEYGWATFLTRAMARLDGSPVDAFGWHPYMSGVTEADPAQHVFDLVRAFRLELRALGRGAVPMEINEVGVARSYAWLGDASVTPEAGVVLTEDQRAAFYAKVIPTLAGSDCGIASIAPLQFSSDREIWTLPDADADPMDVARYIATIFSIADSDSNLRPSGVAYRDAVAAVEAGKVPADSNHLCS